MVIKAILKYLIISFILLFSLLVVYFSFILIWTSGGEVVNQPDMIISATAEYLYQNPIATPNNFTFPLGDITYPYEICVELIDGAKHYIGNWMWGRWFLNGQRVPNSMYDFYVLGTLSDSIGGDLTTCLNISEMNLEGINLFQVEFRSSPFYVDTSYEWALNMIRLTSTPAINPPP